MKQVLIKKKFKSIPSEILELSAPWTIAQVLCATLQRLIFNYTIMTIIVMCSGKSPLYSHCIMAVRIKLKNVSF